MKNVDLLITNPNHHVQIVAPLAAELSARGWSARILSLCELRGWTSPSSPIAGAPVLRLVPPLRRSTPNAEGGEDGSSRQLMRSLVWATLVRPALARATRARRPGVVTACNDIAFPSDRVLGWFAARDIPRVLVPEGIRFAPSTRPGSTRVSQVAAWGPASVDYFVAEGYSPQQVHALGSPRHDEMIKTLRGAPTRERTVAVITNPVDAPPLSLCTTAHKTAVVAGFVTAILRADPDVRVLLKTHPAEDVAQYDEPLAAAVATGRVSLAPDAPLPDVLTRSLAVVILGSTVGIEALLAGTPLFVLPLPGGVYLHDYVQRGGAVGLADPPTPEQCSLVLRGNASTDARSAYLDTQLSNRGHATSAVCDLIETAGMRRPPDRTVR